MDKVFMAMIFCYIFVAVGMCVGLFAGLVCPSLTRRGASRRSSEKDPRAGSRKTTEKDTMIWWDVASSVTSA